MNEKKKKPEIAVVLLCILGIVICIYLLNTHSFLDSKNQSQEVVLGEINETSLDVRLKSNKQYFWQKTERNQVLTEGDSVFTGPKSSSEITLLDGKKIRISENSLIRFATKNQQLSVDLAFGKLFSTGSTQPIVISDCGKLYTIEPNAATFELSKGKNCGSIEVNVSKGTIKLNKKFVAKKKPQPQLAKSNFSVIEDDFQPPLLNASAIEALAKPVEIAAAKAKLETPQFEKKLYNMTLTKSLHVDFSWNSVPDASEYILEQSETELFELSDPVHVSTTSYSYHPETDGVRFFRLKAIDEKGSESGYGDVAKTSLIYPNIELEQKKIKAQYKARTSTDFGSKKNFPISWSTVPHAAKYVVEVADNSDFSKSIPTISRKPASNIVVPKTGLYHYRVSAFNQQGRKISSSDGSGEINYEKMFDMLAPVIEPTLKSLSFYFQKQFGQFIWLRWIKASNSSGLKYRFQLATSAGFEKLFYDQLTTENKILLNKNLLQGEYFWRIRSENEAQTSDWSDLGSFKIQTQTTNAKNTK